MVAVAFWCTLPHRTSGILSGSVSLFRAVAGTGMDSGGTEVAFSESLYRRLLKFSDQIVEATHRREGTPPLFIGEPAKA